MSVDTEFTAKEVAAHREREDAWMVINGEGEQLQGEVTRGTKKLTSDIQSMTLPNIWKSIQEAQRF